MPVKIVVVFFSMGLTNYPKIFSTFKLIFMTRNKLFPRSKAILRFRFETVGPNIWKCF